MITEIITAITEWLTGMLSAVISAVNGIIPLFYDADATGSKLTVLGMLALFGLGFGLVNLGIKFVQRFFVKG